MKKQRKKDGAREGCRRSMPELFAEAYWIVHQGRSNRANQPYTVSDRERNIGKYLGDVRIVMPVAIPRPARARVERLTVAPDFLEARTIDPPHVAIPRRQERPSASSSRPRQGNAISAVQPRSVLRAAVQLRHPHVRPCASPGKSQSRKPQRSPRGWTWPPTPSSVMVRCVAGSNSGLP